MRILFDIGHPAHVHLIRNAYFELKRRNHFIIVTVKDLPSAIQLLELYKINYIKIGIKKDNIILKGLSQVKYNYKILKLVIKHKIDVGVGSSITLAHISKISSMKSIILDDDDDEVEPLFVKYAHPFADVILSPEALRGKRKSKKTIFYPGYHELAYLHPDNFTQDVNVLQEVGLTLGSAFYIMRFNAFKAHHDIGINGLSIEQKLKLINLLERHGKVFITTEREIEPELKKYQLPLSPEKTHSLMSYASMFLGDSQTMTSEAAVLGVPAIRCNSFAGRISTLEEEEQKYGLTFGFLPTNFESMLNKVDSLIQIKNLSQEWGERKVKMLEDKINVTNFFIWFIENYPNSKQIMEQESEFDFAIFN